MKKFYEKSEIWFAVMWIIIYVVVMGNLRNNFGDDSVLSFVGLLAIATVITCFIFKNKLVEKYGFVKVKDHKRCLFFIPFIILMSVNFWPGFSVHYALPGQIYAVLTMALVGYVEEVIFRGLLFKAIEKDSVKQAIIISAITFGAGHIINLLTGHASFDTLLQIAYAIAIGFAFVMVFYKSKSIWPCIITHSFIDVASKFSGESSKTLDIVISSVIIVVAGGYALYLGGKATKEL